MSALKPLLPPRPSAADRTLLPAALTALLAAGLVVLVALPSPVPLPEGGAVTPLRLPPLADNAVVADRIVVQRTLFSPTRRDDAGVANPGSGAAAAEPLGGARVAGVALSPGRARVFLIAPDGRIAALAPGNVYQGWQLLAVSRTAVRFGRDGDRIDLTVGSVAGRPKPAQDTGATAEENPS